MVAEALRRVAAADKRGSRSRGAESSEAESEAAVQLIDWPEGALSPGFRRRAGISTWRVADYSDVERVGAGPGPGTGTAASKRCKEGEGSNNEDDEDANDFGRLSWYDTYEEAEKGADSGTSNAFFGNGGDNRSLWPSTSEDEMRSYRLERCVRLWPQDHDTGGFFVALLRKNR